jgi:hypothetical protein
MTTSTIRTAWLASAVMCACLVPLAIAQAPVAPDAAQKVPAAPAAPSAADAPQRALPAVEDLAPKSTFLAVGVKDMGALAERFSATPLAKLLEDPKVKALMDEPAQAAEAEERKKRLAEMGIDGDSVPWPGAVRLALFVDRDPELDADAIGVMLCADYGANADAAAHEGPDFSHATASSTRLAPQSPRLRRRSPRRHVDAQRLETNKLD